MASSGSVEPVALSCTESGAVPLVGVAVTAAFGGWSVGAVDGPKTSQL